MTSATKTAIRTAMGADLRRRTSTHNGGQQQAVNVVYRAADVAARGLRPTNLDRRLPGGRTVGEILSAAGIVVPA